MCIFLCVVNACSNHFIRHSDGGVSQLSIRSGLTSDGAMNEENEVAVAWAIGRDKTKLKSATKSEYEQKFDRMMLTGVMPGMSEVPNTRMVQRAAARHILAHEIIRG
jgi:hypothetical protein